MPNRFVNLQSVVRYDIILPVEFVRIESESSLGAERKVGTLSHSGAESGQANARRSGRGATSKADSNGFGKPPSTRSRNREQERLRAKAQRIEEILIEYYGPRIWSADNYISDLVGALVATILSQNTSDINSGRAYANLKAAFPGGWEDVRTAPVNEVADAIRAGGLANIKAPRIQIVLDCVHDRFGRTDLDHIRDWDDDAIRDLLRSFPGVGAKTAACVLMFNLGRAALPVDTHVHRVAGRLGLIGPKVNAEKAHEDLRALYDDHQTYSVHVHLIEHGRQICHARRPECDRCPVAIECDYFRNQKF
jgi:endonuclease-3